MTSREERHVEQRALLASNIRAPTYRSIAMISAWVRNARDINTGYFVVFFRRVQDNSEQISRHNEARLERRSEHPQRHPLTISTFPVSSGPFMTRTFCSKADSTCRNIRIAETFYRNGLSIIRDQGEGRADTDSINDRPASLSFSNTPEESSLMRTG